MLGVDKANHFFPQYVTLPDKMSRLEQVNLARKVLDRLDNELDKDTVPAIRGRHPCGIPKTNQQQINEIKSHFVLDE